MKATIITLMAACLPTVMHAQETTDSLNRSLQEIVVTANNPAVTLKGNSIVATITGSVYENIGTAFEMLAQMPMIDVSDQSITVTGKGVPEIYIDGREMRDMAELQQLLSRDIRKVEVDMAPGAKYEATTKAVINITTHRRLIKGLSVTEQAEVTARRRWSANNLLDLNYRMKNLDIFATGSVARNNSLTKGSTTNTLEYNGTETTIGSSQRNKYPTLNGTVKTGFNYAKESQSFGAYYRYNPEKGNFTNNGSEWTDSNFPVKRRISNDIHAHSHLGAAYYDNMFAGRYHLHFDGTIRFSKSRSNASTTYPEEVVADVNSSSLKKSRLLAGKLYIELPLAGGEFTAGVQASNTSTSLEFDMKNTEVGTYIPSSYTSTRQTSASTFASWRRNWEKLTINAGLRYEHVDYSLETKSQSDTHKKIYSNTITPDISIGYTIGKRHNVNLSYKVATIKPPYAQLTESLNYTGMHEIEGGNPQLRDERMHDLQMLYTWGDFIVQADYTRSNDTYAFVKRIYDAPTLQLIMQPINIDVSSIDIYAMWGKRIGIWNPQVTAGVHKQWLDIEGTRYNKPIFSYFFDNILSLPGGVTLTLNARGSTEGDIHTNRFGTTWFTLDASLSKWMLDKSLQLKLSATDIFNTSSNDWSMNTYGVYVDKRQSYDRRGVSLTLTYRFQPQKSKYKGADADVDEMRRF